MNIFLEQGRCRVCGRIFCCSNHQKQHEKTEHAEYSEWLDMLPICCRSCGKRASTIYDLRCKCMGTNTRHCFVEGPFSAPPKLSRKRRLDENLMRNSAPDDSPALRRRLVPSQKSSIESVANSPNLLLFDSSRRRIWDAANNAFVSPQLNVTCTFVETGAKSSTTFNEDTDAMISTDRENIAVVSVSVQQNATTFCTPENAIGTPFILVSAMKKTISSPSYSNRKFSDRRKVTFDTASPSDGEVSIYGTPPVTFDAESEETIITHEMVIVSPAINENVESIFPAEADLSEEAAGEHALSRVARNVRLTLNGIPRSLTSIWEWTQRRISRKKQRDECDSPVSLRNKMKMSLKRRPISSYWVNMSITSMARDPLPHYKEKYSTVDETE